MLLQQRGMTLEQFASMREQIGSLVDDLHRRLEYREGAAQRIVRVLADEREHGRLTWHDEHEPTDRCVLGGEVVEERAVDRLQASQIFSTVTSS